MSITAGRPATGASRTAKGQHLTLIEGDRVDIGPCPEVLGGQKPLAQTVETWERIRKAPHLAQLVQTDADLAVLHTYIALADERERAFRAYRRRRFIPGASGQEVLNPAWKVVTDCAKQMQAIEDRFGFSLLSRARLGVEVSSAAKGMASVADLFAQIAADDDFDPRVGVVDVEVVDG